MKNRSTARPLYALGCVWIFGLLLFLLSGGPKVEPIYVTVLCLAWSAFLIWVTFRAATKSERNARSTSSNKALL